MRTLLSLLLTCWGLGLILEAQEPPATNWAPGQLHIYQKSNWDGSRPGQLGFYRLGPDSLFNFKWHEGEPGATLVLAIMDWERGSARTLVNFQVSPDGSLTERARLTDRGDGLVIISLGNRPPDTVRLTHFPWHSFDFDLASLNLSWQYVASPRDGFSFQVSDVMREPDGPPFGEKGGVEVTYLGQELYEGLLADKYQLTGPGMSMAPAYCWVHPRGQYFLSVKVPVPDEPGFDNFLLQWRESHTLDRADWWAWVRDKVR